MVTLDGVKQAIVNTGQVNGFDPEYILPLIDEVIQVYPDAQFATNQDADGDAEYVDTLWVFTGVSMADVLTGGDEIGVAFTALREVIEREDRCDELDPYLLFPKHADEIDYQSYAEWSAESIFGYKFPIPEGMGAGDQIVWRLWWD